MNPIVLSSLIPVVLLIAIGFIAARASYIRAEATKYLATLVFTVLTSALLFRTMRTVHVERLDFKPVAVYFAAATLLFAAMVFWQGASAGPPWWRWRPPSATPWPSAFRWWGWPMARPARRH